MSLTLVPVVNNSPRVENKGTSVPSWYGNESNKSTWYSDGNTNYFFYNLLTNKIYIQYGQNNDMWGSGRFLVQALILENETLNEDNSYTVDIVANLEKFKIVGTDFQYSPFEMTYRIRMNGELIYTYTGTTFDEIDLPENEVMRRVTIPPQETHSGSALSLEIEYHTGNLDDQIITMGLGVRNNLQPSYKPMSIRKNNQWESLDRPSGFIQRRMNHNWVDKSQENFNTQRQVNQGKNRIRRNQQWLQLPKM